MNESMTFNGTKRSAGKICHWLNEEWDGEDPIASYMTRDGQKEPFDFQVWNPNGGGPYEVNKGDTVWRDKDGDVSVAKAPPTPTERRDGE